VAQEMFGKHAPAIEQNSEDEDWGPGKRKRRRKEPESDAASTLITLFESERSCPEKTVDEVEKESLGRPAKREIFRIPPDAVEVICFFAVFVVTSKRKHLLQYSYCSILLSFNRNFAVYLLRMNFHLEKYGRTSPSSWVLNLRR